MFEVGLAKSTQNVMTILIQLVDKLQSYESLVRIVKYKIEVYKYKKGVAVKLKEVMKEVPSFIKILKEYFGISSQKDIIVGEFILRY